MPTRADPVDECLLVPGRIVSVWFAGDGHFTDAVIQRVTGKGTVTVLYHGYEDGAEEEKPPQRDPVCVDVRRLDVFEHVHPDPNVAHVKAG